VNNGINGTTTGCIFISLTALDEKYFLGLAAALRQSGASFHRAPTVQARSRDVNGDAGRYGKIEYPMSLSGVPAHSFAESVEDQRNASRRHAGAGGG